MTYRNAKISGICITSGCRMPAACDSLRCEKHRDSWRKYHRNYMKSYRAKGNDSWLNRKKNGRKVFPDKNTMRNPTGA